ncbi:D-alanine--D-alanine ligase family protein [Euzebya tangerina]|uniref:D-alanine--D-alanine ligase family protein n=1 Tax=Euzebya tangerina TaxID=591198 RepID=UPI000E3106D8|nr:D-alanine--D-alanine ligase family protein [Euzebya tangerina]
MPAEDTTPTAADVPRQRVLVLFGGRSSEHEVSCLSARGVLWAIDRERYDVVAVGITKDGRWVLMPQGVPATREGTLPAVPSGGTLVTVATTEAGTELLQLTEDGSASLGTIDVCFPVLHGPYGEDGTIQGYLASAGVPYVGADVAASAIAVDKRQMKHVFAAAGLPQVAHDVVMREDWDADTGAELDRIEAALEYPLFTKPARQGSSIGINRVADREALAAGVVEALEYDRVVIIEEGLDGVRELECGVIGNDTIEVTVPGETLHTGEAFYDFEAKYLEPVQLQCPARVSDEVAEACQDFAAQAYRAIGARGMARVDFFYDTTTDRLLVNEINTIPGLTPQSMFPPVWAASGLEFKDLIDRLLSLAVEAAEVSAHYAP